MPENKTINLAAAIENSEYLIDKRQYEILKRKKSISWVECQDELEWLVKLHYLRTLFKEKKIEKQNFVIKEQALILKWWTKFCNNPR